MLHGDCRDYATSKSLSQVLYRLGSVPVDGAAGFEVHKSDSGILYKAMIFVE